MNRTRRRQCPGYDTSLSCKVRRVSLFSLFKQRDELTCIRSGVSLGYTNVELLAHLDSASRIVLLRVVVEGETLDVVDGRREVGLDREIAEDGNETEQEVVVGTCLDVERRLDERVGLSGLSEGR